MTPYRSVPALILRGIEVDTMFRTTIMKTMVARLAYREWRRAVDSRSASATLAISLCRSVRQSVGADEAEDLTGAAFAYLLRQKARVAESDSVRSTAMPSQSSSPSWSEAQSWKETPSSG